MIVTKAYIKSIPEKGENIYTVNVPLMVDNANEEAIFDAILAESTGVYNDYKVDDCVIVTFEDDKYNIAIILGKLYTDVPEENNAYGIFDQLKVTGNAVLPNDTKIGDYSALDFVNLYNGVANNAGGSLNPDDLAEYLEPYVQWLTTKRTVDGALKDIYANYIKTMTGQEYKNFITNHPADYDQTKHEHTLYFLSSLPPA